ncbi:MAG: hypothetical protein KKA36_07445 [Gammaproteobacteria bacterium]|nr:hypothetical protein [Gammaproteobacteria bacterium]MBU2478911.1 hypothetical protein [Gammaproteobacteria bacterium]
MRMFAGLLTAALTLLPVAATVQAADVYKPFILASRGSGDMTVKVNEVKEALKGAGFEVVTDFEPYENAHVVVFTNDAIKSVAAKSEYGGYAMAQRVAVTKVGDELQVSYVNPVYMATAYQLKSDLANTAEALGKALGNMQEFGSEKGLSARKLGKYHYTFGMEYFKDQYELATYGSYSDAVKAVEKNLVSNKVGVRQLYRLDVPGKEEAIFGVSMNAGPDGDQYMDDKFQMGIVDFGELKGTPYLPYEIMVTGNRVVAMNMRFRMAVHYPDLKMMGDNSFMKLMPSPEAIRKALTEAVGGKP